MNLDKQKNDFAIELKDHLLYFSLCTIVNNLSRMCRSSIYLKWLINWLNAGVN